MEKLKIKFFGPIKSVNLILKPILLLIGPQSSGKSTIGKLISIFRDPRFVSRKDSFDELLNSFDLDDYLTSETEITYSSENYSFSFKNKEETFLEKNESFSSLLDTYESQQIESAEVYKEKRETIEKLINDLKTELEVLTEHDFKSKKDYIDSKFKVLDKLGDEIKDYNKKFSIKESYAVKVLSYSKFSIYVPSDRNLYSSVLSAKFSLSENNIPLPKTILKFGSLIERARQNVKNFNIGFLDIGYHFIDDESYIEDNITKKRYLLKKSSSGLQSLIPLIHVIQFAIDNLLSNTFVIEEPELNLFPKSQYEIVKFIIENCYSKFVDRELKNDLIITTHSPYCLSAINNMLMAFKTNEISSNNKKISKIIKKESWINPQNFSAYYMDKGKAKSIMDKKTGLIDDNELDSTSNLINNDFQNLLEIISHN